jgi:glutathione synthase/RimK-type ligase-like ATP-grasp enzyme
MYSHNPNSEGASQLAAALGIRRIRETGSTYVGRPGKIVINWGSSRIPDHIRGSRLLNAPDAVAMCSNKRSFFNQIAWNGENVRVPENTTDQNEAMRWVLDGGVVCARTVLSGHSAEGLVILESGIDFVAAPLYTRYIKKTEEWRIHVFEGRVIARQQKLKRNDFDGEVNWRIRNHDNGFIYAREVEEPHQDIVDQAVAAVAAIPGLDFGAVDVIWNQQQGRAYVLEINTAPGLSGQTVTDYANAFLRYV